MTTAELNRDIKRLAKQLGTDKEHTEEFKKEFLRLYGADNDFKYSNKDSVLTLLRINLRHRFIALHQFGIHITINGI